ncbi:potassium channel subfamily T member 1 [Elysia marginata]|uniref:Potassium channel subfamily T member 1 n=1 Tax=Elysia marginata TaxID=1093978 RepID=A0AAV4GHL9_9GAST|nr:potassium channel subfamily T member 1 [Elysia marginata]
MQKNEVNMCFSFCFLFLQLAYPPLLKDLFVPMFLNCRLAQRSLQKIYNDLHLTRQKFQTITVTLLQQMIILMTNIICLGFVTICMIQHLQRASPDLKLTMFDSLYFVVVTFSTVGYGDISPDIWLSRLYMLLVICVAFASLPRQIEGLISTYMERKKAGGEYSRHAAQRYRHVIVCTSSLTQDTVIDFLNEFYAHPKLEDHTVIVLCPQELDSGMQVVLKDPKWAHRVIYMRGSSLKDIDLTRCHVLQADACFFLAPRPTHDKIKADRHTILRSWAVKDFAPGCKQYIQLFSAANKIHVKFAEHVVCEDEFKYALLANNCLYPGLSTLVSLLVHTSFGHEGILASEPWQQVYGRHSGNEIYHIQLQKSVFFSHYVGETFPKASADAHRRFGVALLAVLNPDLASPHLQLNPGPLYRLKGADFCFYMSVTREEYSEIKPEALKNVRRRPSESVAQIALALQKYHLVPDTSTNAEDPDESVFNTITSLMGNNITRMVHSNNNLHLDDKGDGIATSPTTPLMPEAGDILSTTTTTSTPKNDERTPEAPASGNSTDNNASGSSSERRGRKKKFIVTPASTASDTVDNNSNRNQLHNCCPSTRPLLESNSEDVSEFSTRVGEDFFRERSRSNSVDSLDNVDHRHTAGRVLQYWQDMEQDKLTTGPPPVTIYSGSRRTTCHIMTEPRNICCIQWGQDCDHCTYKNARDERWGHQLIILAAEHASTGIFNFIVPLRSSFIGIHGLSPIVMLLEEEPDSLFLDTIAQFPLVYYMIGSIRSVDDLLISGINKASHLVVVNRDSEACHGGEEILADSETIVAVQTIFRLFPNTYVVTELSQTSNMRFMQFTAQEAFALKTSKLEQRLKESVATNLNHIFRLPFAAGQVFSARMLDTLLYQTFVKGYLISFVRLLLGIDAEEGSGHLSSIRVKRATLQKFPEYGELYEGLCTATGEIPFAIYRTERADNETGSLDAEHSGTEKCKPNSKRSPRGLNNLRKSSFKPSSARFSHRFSNLTRQDHGDLGSMIRNRLRSLDLSLADYSDVRRRPDTLSYIITNPSPKLKLRIGDIVYVIQPSSMYAKPSKQKFFMRRSHSFSDDKLSTPPPTYQQLARQRAQSNVESLKNFTVTQPKIPPGKPASGNSPGFRNPLPPELRIPKGVSFSTEPCKTTAAIVSHPADDSFFLPSVQCKPNPPSSRDSSQSALPPSHTPGSDSRISHLSKNRPLPNDSKVGKTLEAELTEDKNFVGQNVTLEAVRKNKKEGQGEDIPLEPLPLASDKDSPCGNSFVVNMGNVGLSGRQNGNRPILCHPHHTKSSIPYILAFRLVRICSTEEALSTRFTQLSSHLQKRGFPHKQIVLANNKATGTPRPQALQRRKKVPPEHRGSPSLPNISNILKTYLPILHLPDRCKKAIPELLMTAFRRPTNIRDYTGAFHHSIQQQLQVQALQHTTVQNVHIRIQHIVF